MNNILDMCRKHKTLLKTIFLICIFAYYLIWTVSQPYNSCPDEFMKWDICKYIYENNGSIYNKRICTSGSSKAC